MMFFLFFLKKTSKESSHTIAKYLCVASGETLQTFNIMKNIKVKRYKGIKQKVLWFQTNNQKLKNRISYVLYLLHLRTFQFYLQAQSHEKLLMQMKITKLLIYQIQSQSAIDKAFVSKLPISVQNDMHWRKKMKYWIWKCHLNIQDLKVIKENVAYSLDLTMSDNIW